MATTHRRSHHKTRSGCTSCKIRRVKCDEAHPTCHACLRTNRTCEYTPAAPRVRQTRARPTPPDAFQHTFLVPLAGGSNARISASDAELRAFEHFATQTLPVLSQSWTTHPWSHILVDVQYHAPFVRQCCIAVGALHAALSQSQGRSQSGLVILPSKTFHQEQHIQALVQTRKAIASGTCSAIAVKLSCILLSLYASLEHDQQGLSTHLGLGLGLLREDSEAVDHAPVNSALRSIGYYTLVSYPLKSDLGSLQRLLDHYRLTPPHVEVVDLPSARSMLHLTLPCITAYRMRLGHSNLSTAFEQGAAHAALEKVLKTWRERLNNLQVGADLSNEEKAAFALLTALWCKAFIELQTEIVSPEKQDQCLMPLFSEMIQSVQDFLDLSSQSQNSLSWNTGLIPQLHLALTQCRHVPTRKRALDLLKRVPRREWLWDADALWKKASA